MNFVHKPSIQLGLGGFFMFNIRKHGVYAVEETQLEGRKSSVNSNKSWTPISYGMEVVFKQMPNVDCW